MIVLNFLPIIKAFFSKETNNIKVLMNFLKIIIIIIILHGDTGEEGLVG